MIAVEPTTASFPATLQNHGLALRRGTTEILKVDTGIGV